MNGRLRRRIQRWSNRKLPNLRRYLLATAIALLHGCVFSSPLGRRLEPNLADLWHFVRGPVQAPDDIVIIATDEQSYNRLQLSQLEPWPRSLHTRLLERLVEYGAKTVIFDLVFCGASSDPAADRGFAESLRRVRSVIATYKHAEGDSESGVETVNILPILRESAADLMFINIPTDFGTVRRFPFRLGEHPDRPPIADALGSTFASYPDENDYIYYYGPADTIPSISYSKIIEDQEGTLKKLFRGKYVIVGTKLLTDAGNPGRDSFLTPASQGLMFGVEIHATMAGNMLQQRWLRRAPLRTEAAILNIAAFLLMAGIVTLKPQKAFLLLVATELIWGACAYTAFLFGYFVPGAILMLVILPLALLTATFFYYVLLQNSYADMESALGIKLHRND